VGKPSTKVIVGIAILIATDILYAFSVHSVISTGTCSSTGYATIGPVPHCPKGTAVFSLFLPLGAFLVIMGGWLAEASLTVPSLFCAIGIGSLVAGISPSGGNGSAAFALIFGGCFLIAGVAWAGIALAAGRRSSSKSSRSGIGESVIFSGRAGFAGLVWVAAAALAIGVGLIATPKRGSRLIATAAASPGVPRTDLTRAPLPRPAGPAVMAPTNQLSLFRAARLTTVLGALTARYGSTASVVQLALYPGQLELVIADNDSARLVTADALGGVTRSPQSDFSGSRQAVSLSQISGQVPAELAHEIADRGGVPLSGLDRFVLDLSDAPTAHWLIYPSGGGTFYRALLSGGGLDKITPQSVRSLS
jgi:hypothetical protein